MFAWTTMPPELAAEEWVPSPMYHAAPERFVTRVRGLLASGEYKLVVSPDGLGFVGTPAECEAHINARQSYLIAPGGPLFANAASSPVEPNDEATTEQLESAVAATADT
jgi:hypothetical protein